MKIGLRAVLLLLIVCTPFISPAQITADASGIPIQGIARDDNGNVRPSVSITLTLSLYTEGNENAPFVENNLAVATDAFGVFSTVFDVDKRYQPIMAAQGTYLKIAEGSTVISNEPLGHVPYAINANNGVPTGSIMPYMGTTAPAGWVLCNGQDVSGMNGAETLRALLGSNNVPDLRGMFLRGAGEAAGHTAEMEGHNVATVQTSANKAHQHGKGTLVTEEAGEHNHNNGAYDRLMLYNGQDTYTGDTNTENDNVQVNMYTSQPLLPAGAHTHDITGSTANQGELKARPINYAVNYIIKL